jgi:membrane protein implicated in regulation of membrane protease activity
MLPIYIFSFTIGGIFVALAALAGLDGVDFDDPFDADIEVTEESRNIEEGEKILTLTKRPKKMTLWLPFLTIKFWTFGSCFFGLTGIVLSKFTPGMSEVAIASISVLIGSFCGTSMVWVLRNLRRHQADSLIRANDLIGLSGKVSIPFDSQSKGKVQLTVKGSNLDLVAFTDEEKGFNKGDRVLVVGLKNNQLWVVTDESTDI